MSGPFIQCRTITFTNKFDELLASLNTSIAAKDVAEAILDVGSTESDEHVYVGLYCDDAGDIMLGDWSMWSTEDNLVVDLTNPEEGEWYTYGTYNSYDGILSGS